MEFFVGVCEVRFDGFGCDGEFVGELGDGFFVKVFGFDEGVGGWW